MKVESVVDDSHITGCILGTAVGDAIGLPYEGVSRQRLPRLLGPPERHRFLFGRGMISDDTEHTCLVAQSLIVSDCDVDLFERDLAKRFRWWLASLPAGLGRATLRSCLKLWFGVPPNRSGVFSAGNGPAMRSAIFGAYFDDVERIVEFAKISARITHSDPKAEYGAIAVALATYVGRKSEVVDGEQFLQQLSDLIAPAANEFIELLKPVVRSNVSGESTLDFAANNGCENGVSGYTYHTVPIAIHAWLSNPKDYREAVTSVIQCGGDCDTTAAIVGGIIGASTGEPGIPAQWLSNIVEWPRSVDWMRRLSTQLSETQSDRRLESIQVAKSRRPLSASYFAVLARNVVFLLVVLVHGFRRLLPPY